MAGAKKALKLCQIQDNSANLFCVQRRLPISLAIAKSGRRKLTFATLVAADEFAVVKLPIFRLAN
jgi:hypothetical protein